MCLKCPDRTSPVSLHAVPLQSIASAEVSVQEYFFSAAASSNKLWIGIESCLPTGCGFNAGTGYLWEHSPQRLLGGC